MSDTPHERPLQDLPAASPAAGNGVKWVILAITVGCYLAGFIVRFAWPPMIAVAAPDLGFDMARAGLFMSAFYIGYVVTHIPAGLLADRFGIRYLMTGAMLLEGLSCLGMTWITSFSPGFWLRLAGGLGAGVVYAGAVRSITTWFSVRERGVAFGIMMLSPSAGVLLANQLVPAVCRFYDWRSAFTVVGWTAIALAVLLFCRMRETGRRADDQHFLEGLKFIVGHRDLMLMAFAGFCLMWIQIGFISWSNVALKRLGFSLVQAGFCMTVYGLGGLIGPLVSGLCASRLRNKKWFLVGSYPLMIPLVLTFGRQSDFAALAAIAGSLGFLIGFANTFLPLLVSEYSGAKWAASAGGITGTIFQTASIFGPLLMGLSIDMTGSFTFVWWLVAAGPLTGVLLLLPLRMPTHHRV